MATKRSGRHRLPPGYAPTLDLSMACFRFKCYLVLPLVRFFSRCSSIKRSRCERGAGPMRLGLIKQFQTKLKQEEDYRKRSLELEQYRKFVSEEHYRKLASETEQYRRLASLAAGHGRNDKARYLWMPALH